MRLLVVVLLFCACGHGESPPPPELCNCFSEGDCCEPDSVVCQFDEVSDTWMVLFCDPPAVDPCDQCASDEICVQSFDGVCGGSSSCAPRTVECPGNVCSTECEEEYCSAPFQCQNRSPCGGESPLAFTCYGP